MLKLLSHKLSKLGQTFLDELEDVDWGDDEPTGRISPHGPGSARPSGRISPHGPHGPQGVIDSSNYEKYEPSVADQKEPDVEQISEEQEIPEFLQEIPSTRELHDIPKDAREVKYENSLKLVYDGIDKDEIISFDYTNRHGGYAGTRTVEPHYTFVARTTGNEVLVTWDLDKDDIRAFIVGNIHRNGVRYNKAKFQPKGEIMKGIYQ